MAFHLLANKSKIILMACSDLHDLNLLMRLPHLLLLHHSFNVETLFSWVLLAGTVHSSLSTFALAVIASWNALTPNT